jgi:hypothetical protein
MTNEAGAVTPEPAAEQTGGEQKETTEQGGQETVESGTDTQEGAAAEQGGGDEATDAGDGEGGEEKKAKHQKNADERIRELLEKDKVRERELADLRTRFEEQQKAKGEEKPFHGDDVVARAQARVESLYQEAEALRLAGRLTEANRKQREAFQIEDGIEANALKKAEWEKQQAAKTDEAKGAERFAKHLDDAADFYRDAKKIPKEVFDQGAKTFWEMVEADKLLGRRYFEIAQTQGPTAAIDFAYGKVTEHQSAQAKKAEAEKKKREEGKGRQVGGAGGGSTDSSVTSYKQWYDMPPKQRTEWRAKHPEQYQKMYDKHINSN